MSPRLIAVIDVLDGDHVRQSFPIHHAQDAELPTLRIGRGLGCEIALDDPHLAAEHAQLQLTADAAQLSLLPSLNGAVQGHHHHRAGEQLAWPADGVVQLGHTRLRLRHAGAPLAPEKPMLHTPRWLGLALLALALLVYVTWSAWRPLDPGAPWMAYAAPVLGWGAALMLWASAWALLTQLFQRRFPFFLHLRRVLVVSLALGLSTELLPALAFVTSAPWLLIPSHLLPALSAVVLLYWHARDVWPRAKRWLLLLLGAGTLLWLANGWTRQEAQQHRWREPYLSTLLPPAWRMAPLHRVDTLLQDAAALREPLAAKAKRDADEVNDGED